jgi:excisionase family DNA binding protein
VKTQTAKSVDRTVWLSSEEVAQQLGLSHWTVLRWAKSGASRLPAYKVWDESAGDQGRFRFRKEDVDAFILADSGRVEGTQAPPAADLAPAARTRGGDPIDRE